MRVYGLALALLLFFPLAARAECDLSGTDAERSACIGQELRQSDGAINDTYKTLRDKLDDAGKLSLRDEQRKWLKARDKVCELADIKETDREKWFAALLTDYRKTVCVVHYTELREQTLKSQLAALSAPPADKPAQPAPAPAPAAADEDVYDMVLHAPVSKGRWYFEAKLNVPEMAKLNESTLYIGAFAFGGQAMGTLQAVRHHDVKSDPRSIGVAVDLDEGFLYIRRNGAWGVAPGAAGGLLLKLGRPYMMGVSSSATLNDALAKGLVELNFGQKPFEYAIPDGYLPADPKGPVQVVTDANGDKYPRK